MTWDGWKPLRIATSELVGGIPCQPASQRLSGDSRRWRPLRKQFPKRRVPMRATGRYIRAEAVGATPPKGFGVTKLDVPGLEDAWRLDCVAFRP